MNRCEIGLPVAILAGGLATRLRPLTETVPKVLLEVAGKPFLEHQLLRLREQGIRDIVLCVGFLGEVIRDRFGNGRNYGVRIRYSFDGPVLLGTGGAIHRAAPMLGDAFFVLYGDSYLTIDYSAVADSFFDSGGSALMTVFKNQNEWDTSNVHFENGQIQEYNKHDVKPQMHHIDYGLSVFRTSVFAKYSGTSFLDLSDVMRDLALRGELTGYEASNRFYEIGSHAGLTELDGMLTAGQHNVPPKNKAGYDQTQPQ
jgi:N-acetyl-alpha-D-muramate 1-phosphate uridylyltransferase